MNGGEETLTAFLLGKLASKVLSYGRRDADGRSCNRVCVQVLQAKLVISRKLGKR